MPEELNDSGYTVVEIIISLVVGAILFGALNTIFVNHNYLSQRTRDIVLANAFAEKKIESLRSEGFLTLTDGTFDITSELPTELNTPRSGTVTISTPETGIKQVSISMTYNQQGNSVTESYSTYIGELGVGQY